MSVSRHARVALIVAVVLVGAALAVLPARPAYAGTTGRADGLVAFLSDRSGTPAIWLTAADGTGARQLTAGPDLDPAWSPDGTRIAFTRLTAGGAADVYVVRADGVGGPTRVATGRRPSWAPDGGSIAYDLDGDIWVARASGAGARRVTAGPEHDSWAEWSPDGRRIAFASTRTGVSDIYTLDCTAAQECDGTDLRRLTTDPGIDIAPKWSPDGRRLAYRAGDDVWVMDRDGSDKAAVVTDPGFDADPTWGPDGATLIFASTRGGDADLYRARLDGTDVRNLTSSPATDAHADWQVPWRAQVGFSTVDEAAGELPAGCAAAGPTTGGAVATRPPVVVDTAAELVRHATGPQPRTILVDGVLDLSGRQVLVGSHRTISGLGTGSGIRNGGLILKDVCNVVVRNLALGPAGKAKDVLRLTGRTFHVWVDHNTFDSGCDEFNDCYDGLLDAREEVDLVTVSWNTFRNHGKVALITVKGDEGATAAGLDDLRMTYHHNVFEHVGSRAPQFAFGTLHAFANSWSGAGEAVHCHSGARCLVEANLFADVDHPLRTFDAELCKKGTCAAGIGAIDLHPALGSAGLDANSNGAPAGFAWLGSGDDALRPVHCDKVEPKVDELNLCDVDPAGFGYAYGSYVEPLALLPGVLSTRAGATLR